MLSATLSGCATGALLKSQLGDVVKVDLVAAKTNFESVGMTTEATCMQKIIDKIGVEEAQNLQVSGLVSLGSVAYIKYSQLQGSQKTIIPDECYSIVGKVTIAAGKQGAGFFSGGLLGK